MKVVIVIVGLLICLIVVSLLFPTVHVGLSAGPKALAKNDVVQLKTALQAYLVEYDQPPPGDKATLMKILQGFNPKKIVFIAPEKKQISRDGVFIDPWGSPYTFGYSTPSYSWAYSFGKNKIDEGGRGDDVNSWE